MGPRNVRAWWVAGRVERHPDARKIGFGPRGREGNGDVTFYIRDEKGEVSEAFSVLCRTHGKNVRWFEIQDKNGREMFTIRAVEGPES